MHRLRPPVLFVHDDGDVRDDAARWLARGGFRCFVAEDVPSAVRMARHVPPAVAVIASSVEGSDGLAAQLDDRPSTTALVIIDDIRAAASLEGHRSARPGQPHLNGRACVGR